MDLSHTLEENIPSWPTHARYSRVVYESQEFGDVSCHAQVSMSEHSGTHVDAPLHFVPQGKAHYGIDQVPLNRTMGRAATIDGSDLPADGLLTLERIVSWETVNGPIVAGDIVLARYGWDRYWALKPNHRDFLKDWPGLDGIAAQYLAGKGISAFGTDAPSADQFSSEKFPAHFTFLGKEVLILENLAGLDQLPPFCFFMALPLKIKNGSASPIRAVALIPKETSR